MRNKIFPMVAGLTVLFAAGCAGPENKLGRGINNLTEFARLGEINRSVEQTFLWDGPQSAYTTGLIRGINRSLVRTGVGLYEVVTFPIPSYDPVLRPGGPILHDASVDPPHAASYTPHMISSTTFEPDAALGFSGGDIAPFVPGSRFRIFDY
ncbi:MAG TPA: exosortase system-associated protein, TIGR04073 family [Candidatus Paceibacterota bacterium]|nr:exosortase system-associated protein, TIGR04073 family [Candidatus Paceibacterota bacterium]